MITEKDLQEAIAECLGQRNPTASTCLKLASYYVIQDKMFKEEEHKPEPVQIPAYSYSASPDIIKYDSDTEFAKITYGRSQDEVMKIMDELMSVLQATNPRLYNGVISKF